MHSENVLFVTIIYRQRETIWNNEPFINLFDFKQQINQIIL